LPTYSAFACSIFQVTGILQDDPVAWTEIDDWIESARAAHVGGSAIGASKIAGHSSLKLVQAGNKSRKEKITKSPVSVSEAPDDLAGLGQALLARPVIQHPGRRVLPPQTERATALPN
jgi:hypothetical protein